MALLLPTRSTRNRSVSRVSRSEKAAKRKPPPPSPRSGRRAAVPAPGSGHVGPGQQCVGLERQECEVWARTSHRSPANRMRAMCTGGRAARQHEADVRRPLPHQSGERSHRRRQLVHTSRTRSRGTGSTSRAAPTRRGNPKRPPPGRARSTDSARCRPEPPPTASAASTAARSGARCCRHRRARPTQRAPAAALPIRPAAASSRTRPEH